VREPTAQLARTRDDLERLHGAVASPSARPLTGRDDTDAAVVTCLAGFAAAVVTTHGRFADLADAVRDCVGDFRATDDQATRNLDACRARF
jgi:hypothetical protein